jgi:hypothetical protein
MQEASVRIVRVKYLKKERDDRQEWSLPASRLKSVPTNSSDSLKGLIQGLDVIPIIIHSQPPRHNRTATLIMP